MTCWLLVLFSLACTAGVIGAADDAAVEAAAADSVAEESAAEESVTEDEVHREPPTVVVVVGAGGLPEYAEGFAEWADRWQVAAEQAGAHYVKIGRQDDEGQDYQKTTDRQRLIETLTAHAGEEDAPLWLVLIGHGTFYRDTAKFNLQGPDFSSQKLADWLTPLERPVVVINCASSSGPFIRHLAGPNRVIVTATRSGAEQNYARFGDYMATAIQDPNADLDHDKQVSLLEAFLSASRQAEKFYEEEARLATEHALLDDNGDGLGTPASFYRGVQATGKARDDAPIDGETAARMVLVASDIDRGFTAEQLEQRNAIERKIDQLRQMKPDMDEDTYYEQLEALMIRLAQLYNEVESAQDDS